MRLAENFVRENQECYFHYNPKTGTPAYVGDIRKHLTSIGFWKLKFHVSVKDDDGDVWQWELTYYHDEQVSLTDLKVITTEIFSTYLEYKHGITAEAADFDKWDGRIEVHPVFRSEFNRLVRQKKIDVHNPSMKDSELLDIRFNEVS